MLSSLRKLFIQKSRSNPFSRALTVNFQFSLGKRKKEKNTVIFVISKVEFLRLNISDWFWMKANFDQVFLYKCLLSFLLLYWPSSLQYMCCGQNEQPYFSTLVLRNFTDAKWLRISANTYSSKILKAVLLKA